MSEISALPANIVAWLKEREELKYIKFLTEYPPVKKAVPLRHTTVAVGIESMEIVDSFTENDEGVLIENEYCRQAKIRIRLSIHAPYSSGGSACHEAFTDIIDCLTFASGMDILSSGCNDIVSDRDTDAFVLSAWALVNASLCPAASSSLDFPSFISKELLCSSHINDESIHLSPRQLEFVNQPFVSGSYFGMGDATQSISLGFEPQAVIVVANQMPLIYCNHVAKTNAAYAAVGLRNGSTLGIEVTSNGFKVRSTESEVARSTYPLLNELGTTYYYIALK
ncbi:MAG: hypothetical protein IJB45_07200 [Clostridia bacterium]|nr:hypothetical protein [Clostridia bacterium]